MPKATIYLDQETRDQLEVLMYDELFDGLPEEIKILIRLYFMWEDAE